MIAAQHESRTKAYSYQRFSSPSQASGDSLARQSSLARSYADAHGLLLDDSLTYRDLGVSGFRGRNAVHGELASFLDAVRDGHVAEGSYLLIESLDRLSRDNILRAQAILTNLVLAGIIVVSLTDDRLYSEATLTEDPLGLIYALIIFIRANEESSLKSIRARQAWVRKRENAHRDLITTLVPDWITIVDGQCREIPERVALIQRVFDMALQAQSAQQIATRLNAEGVQTWNDGVSDWSQQRVGTLLRNRRVTGVLPLYYRVYSREKDQRHTATLIENYYPRIISPRTFLRVAALVGNRRSGSNAAKFNVFAKPQSSE